MSWVGVGFALVAGMLWGLVFVGPLLVPEYPAALQSVGRYLAFGLIALPLAWLDRRELARLARSDWIEALKLAAIGNLLYYLLLASAIQRAGGPLPTMIIGTLPVVIAISANLRDHRRDGRLPWRRLWPTLLVMLAGILCVNQVEVAALAQDADFDAGRYLSGVALALGAVACWTWYPLRNAAWIARRPQLSMTAWATAQGLATLPPALAAFVALAWLPGYDWPLGADPLRYAALMAALGLVASWLGTLFWNVASQALPATLSGQLIVFETLFGLAFAYALRGEWPDPASAAGIALLVAGVVLGVRACRRGTA